MKCVNQFRKDMSSEENLSGFSDSEEEKSVGGFSDDDDDDQKSMGGFSDSEEEKSIGGFSDDDDEQPQENKGLVRKLSNDVDTQPNKRNRNNEPEPFVRTEPFKVSDVVTLFKDFDDVLRKDPDLMFMIKYPTPSEATKIKGLEDGSINVFDNLRLVDDEVFSEYDDEFSAEEGGAGGFSEDEFANSDEDEEDPKNLNKRVALSSLGESSDPKKQRISDTDPLEKEIKEKTAIFTSKRNNIILSIDNSMKFYKENIKSSNFTLSDKKILAEKVKSIESLIKKSKNDK